MGLRLAVLLAILSIAAPAQRGGGMPGGRGPGGSPPGSQPPMPHPPMPGPGMPGFGRGSWWRWHGQPANRPATFYWPFGPWFGSPVCGPPWSPAAFPYGYADGFCNPDFNQAPPSDTGPPTPNVIVLPPQPFVPPSAPVPQTNSGTNHPANGYEVFSGDSAGYQVSAMPRPSSVIEDDHPALVVFKAGGMYTTTRYWVQDQKLYFVTALGETLYAPLERIEQVYPGKAGK